MKVDLLNQFASLSYDLYTTDFILEEVNQKQKEKINKVISDDKIILIITSQIEDFQGIYDLLAISSGLSFEDCSVWYYSKKMDGTLITGDRKLRKIVERNEIEVRGIIFILDEILSQGLISFDIAIEKIKLLYKINDRLPQKELVKRLELWKSK